MDLNRLQTESRNWLVSRGSLELPPYTGVLLQSWLHPDLVFRAFRPDLTDFFVFQPALEGPEAGSGSISAMYLVWWSQPFTPTWMSRVGDLVCELAGGAERAGNICWETWGKPGKSTTFGEAGAVWNAVWQGSVCGEIMVFSNLLGEDLSAPVGVAVLNLRQLLSLTLGDSHQSGLSWTGSVGIQDILSWARPTRLSAPGEVPGEFSTRLAQDRWEGIKSVLDGHLSAKHWLEAYRSALDASWLLSDCRGCGVSGEAFQANTEPSLKVLLQKIPALVPRPSVGNNRAGKEAKLR